jgi:hypothetical protein
MARESALNTPSSRDLQRDRTGWQKEIDSAARDEMIELAATA